MSRFGQTLSVSQAAALCGLDRNKISYWIRSNKLRANRIGKSYAIIAEDLVFFLKSTHLNIPSELADANTTGSFF